MYGKPRATIPPANLEQNRIDSEAHYSGYPYFPSGYSFAL
jgi:hypothetical protein